MFCPKCGNEIQEKQKFCAKCGYKIDDSQNVVTNRIADVSEETSTNDSNTTQNSYVPSPNKTKRNKKVLIIAIASSVLVLFVSCVIVFFTSSAYGVYKSVRDGDFDTAVSEYRNEVKNSFIQESILTMLLNDRVDDVAKDFNEGKIDFNSARAELDALKKMQIKGAEEKYKELLSKKANSLLSGFKNGEISYDSALSEISNLKDMGLSDAQEKINELQNSYADVIFADYQDGKTNYAQAYKILEQLSSNGCKNADEFIKQITESNNEDLYNKAIKMYEEKDFENALEIFLQVSDYKESSTYIEKCQSEIETIAFNKKITALKSAKAGDTVLFGKYEQNNKIGESEDIEWIVLKRSGDNVTLLSKKYLDAKVFNTRENRGNWSTSTLREWLNGDFIKTAFSEKEQKYLCESSVKSVEFDSDENERLTTTKDKAYILSVDEFERYSVKKAPATEYTQFVTANYLYVGRWNYADDEISWLRDVGHGVAFQTTNQVRGTGFDGSTLYETEWPNTFCYCVQPVITIQISND